MGNTAIAYVINCRTVDTSYAESRRPLNKVPFAVFLSLQTFYK